MNVSAVVLSQSQIYLHWLVAAFFSFSSTDRFVVALTRRTPDTSTLPSMGSAT